MQKKLKLILDLQFGSTGKGLIAGYLALRDQPDTVVTAWAANAGHTYITPGGDKYIHTMIANGIVSQNLKRLLIGPGSLINPEAFFDEFKAAMEKLPHLANVDVMIHPHAAVITQKHIDEEQGPMTKIGSTKKGCGAAAIDRIRRNPDDNNAAINVFTEGHPLHNLVATVEDYNRALDEAQVIQVEGAQGYSLSMYHGLYPYTTSRDVTTAQIFADCALPIGWIRNTEVIGTLRTFPIRVANRFDEQGTQIGYSGGCYPDQVELDWKDIGIEAELTTVTKLPRRIFTFSQMQLAEAIRQCSVDTLFVNFVNYCRSELELNRVLGDIRSAAIAGGVKNGIGYLGFGPADQDVLELAWDDHGEIYKKWTETAIVRQK